MPLTPDRKRRVERYLDALKRRLVTRVAPIDMEMSTTMKLLSPEAASRLSYTPCPQGTRWGSKWEYGWFRGSIVLPESVKGQRVEFLFRSGESLVFVNGRLSGGINRGHDTILLSEKAVPGERFEILVEAYAGHGRTPSSYGPVNPGELVIPPVQSEQQVFSEASLVIWDEESYQLYMDMFTLHDAVSVMDENSLRRHKIEKALVDVTFIIDLEDDPQAFRESVRRARAFLRPVFAETNGSTAPDMFCVGHAHIDVAWLWPIAQTIRKAGATFSTAVDLMRHYEDYRFVQSQPQLYEYVKKHYPGLYQEIKQAVAAGQWIVDGALWVECDTNLVGGESLIRQFLYGKRFMREEFGVDSKVTWLPDVFGYSGSLPQIMKGCGVEYFSTHKIYWNYHGGTVFPYDTFVWEGIDGTTVLAHNHRNYNAETKPASIVGRWNKAMRKDETDVLLYPFGWGDGGGGPTREHLEFLKRLRDFQGVPRTRQASLEDFFHDVEARGIPPARYVGELYFEAHRGVYTSQARTKWGNRKSEFALREAELWSAAASVLSGREYPHEAIENTWKQVLLNQFHDIIPGSSIARVYDEANEAYDRAIEEASHLAKASRESRLKPNDRAFTVWNSLSWARSVYVKLPVSDVVIIDQDGSVLQSQELVDGTEKALLVRVPSVPSLGARTVYAVPLDDSRLGRCESESPTEKASASLDRDAGEYVLENEFLRLRVNQLGEITSFFDKEAHRELLNDGHTLNHLELYQDQPTEYDAWDIDISYRDKQINLVDCAEVELVTAGPLEVRLRVRRAIHKSSMTQDIIVRSGERRVDFETEIDWDEVHKLLKVAFPVDIHSTDARYEIQFGHVKRPRNENTEFERARFEVSGHKWMDVSEPGYGFSILNDCKYGWDVLGGIPRLTLLRAPVAPDPQADRGKHVFTYAVFAHNEPFGTGVVRQGYELNVPTPIDCGEFDGGLCEALAVGSSPNVVVETVKRSEDGESVVLRMYESVGQRTECSIDLGFDIADAFISNMLEEDAREVSVSGRRVNLTFRPFEVKTLMVVPGSSLDLSGKNRRD